MNLRLNGFLKAFFSAFLLILTAVFTISMAGTLQLTKIGTLDLGGKAYTEWWYTLENPLFVGKADASSTVTIKTDDQTGTATVNSSGDWTYQTTLGMSDHQITITQGSEIYAFTLHITQTLPTSFSGTEQTTGSSSVPATGNDQIVALGIGLGLTLLASYLYISGDSNNSKNPKRLMMKE